MAEIKLTWALFHLLGLPCVALSIFPPAWLKFMDINVGTIEQPYRTILWVLAVVYMVTVIARSIEKWHHSHLMNKEHRQRIREHLHAPTPTQP